MSYTPEQLITRYLQLRDEKEKMENRHKLELMPVKQGMELIEGALGIMILQLPKDGKIKNLKTEVGTAFIKPITTISVTNLPEFTSFALDNDPQMLHIKPSDTGVTGFLERHAKEQAKLEEGNRTIMVIPGLKIDKLNKTIVRKAGTA